MNRRGGTHSTCLQHSVRNKTYLQRIKEVVISPMEAVRTIETVRRLEGMRMGRGYEESEGCDFATLTICAAMVEAARLMERCLEDRGRGWWGCENDGCSEDN